MTIHRFIKNIPLYRLTTHDNRVVKTLLVFGLFAFAGSVFWLANSAAATFVSRQEAEAGIIGGPATTVTDSAASAGSAVKFAPATTPPPSGETQFTLVSMPDTQREINTATRYPRFQNRMTWLAQNKAALNIKYVWQVGDLQDWDDATHSHYERASSALKTLDTAGIPYALTVGNHDTNAVCTGGSACPGADTHAQLRNTTTWNSYYPPSRFRLDGVYEAGKTDNAYRTFVAGGLNFLVLNYELWPRTPIVNWMKTVVAAHPRHNVILISHSHLNGSSGIEGGNGSYGDNSPQYVYDQVIKQYANIRFTFSGHVGNSGFRTDTGINGNKIYSFLDCYHDESTNPMRLLTVNTANNTVNTKVYAPFTNQTRSDGQYNISGISWVR
jgi:hypothetical protein